MASYNVVHLLGHVIKEPLIKKNDEGENEYGIAFLNVIRAKRKVGDGKSFSNCDRPVVMSANPDILAAMETWGENDIVLVKGVIETRSVKKTAPCEHCGTENKKDGELVYVEPIHTLKIASTESSEAALRFLVDNAEMSNQVLIQGRLCVNPKKLSPKEGLIVTQYQLAVRRTYKGVDGVDAKEDDDIFPWVKSYGENAVYDRNHLHVNSEVMIDGFLQARNVKRHDTCDECGKEYTWKDQAMEVVPYITKYVLNYYTEEDIKENKKKQAEQARKEMGIA